MFDQASELRKLVLQSARQQAALSGPAPRLIALAAGKQQVGVTTLAVNLAVALAQHGARVVLVDGNSRGHDVAERCGLPPGLEATTESPHRDIHEVLRRGPAGIQIVPGLGCHRDAEWTESAQHRLLRQLKTLGRHADLVLLDAGCNNHPFLQRCLQEADDVLLVTTSESQAIMDAYARIKNHVSQLASTQLKLVMTQATSHPSADEAHRRLESSCQRFLDRDLPLAATFPFDTAVPQSIAAAHPLVLDQPQSPAAQATVAFAAALLGNPSSAKPNDPHAA